MSAAEAKTLTLHGRAVTYAEAGSGPVLLLIHGMAGAYENWREVIGPLARHHTVIAPDLPGHGASAPGAGDYSLGALAAGLRDLIVALGHERATLVGHSLGGGIAMQFSYQFPEIVERLVLVSSGGLGREVSPVLRAAALPGAELFIAATAGPGRTAGSALARGLAAVGLRANADVAEVARGYASLADPERRAAFLATVRAVIGTRGQSVHAGDRLYLAGAVPRPHRLGRERPDHPGPPWRGSPRSHIGQPPRDLSGRRPPAPARGAGALRRGARAVSRRHRARSVEHRAMARTVGRGQRGVGGRPRALAERLTWRSRPACPASGPMPRCPPAEAPRSRVRRLEAAPGRAGLPRRVRECSPRAGDRAQAQRRCSAAPVSSGRGSRA